MTIAANFDDFTEITNYCKEVARVLKPYGPCNFQSRLLEGKPYIFEINPRFSSSTGMRSLLGVNEAEILLRSEILGQKILEPSILKCSVIRQYTDYLVSTEQIMKLEKENFCINHSENIWLVSCPRIFPAGILFIFRRKTSPTFLASQFVLPHR